MKISNTGVREQLYFGGANNKMILTHRSYIYVIMVVGVVYQGI